MSFRVLPLCAIIFGRQQNKILRQNRMKHDNIKMSNYPEYNTSAVPKSMPNLSPRSSSAYQCIVAQEKPSPLSPNPLPKHASCTHSKHCYFPKLFFHRIRGTHEATDRRTCHMTQKKSHAITYLLRASTSLRCSSITHKLLQKNNVFFCKCGT